MNIKGKGAGRPRKYPYKYAGDMTKKVPEIDLELIEGGESLDNLGEGYYFGVFIDADKIWDERNDSAGKQRQRVRQILRAWICLLRMRPLKERYSLEKS